MIKAISFSRLGNHGRLANQLFQIAGTLGMAEKYKAQALFPYWKYEEYFEIQLPHGDIPADVARVEEEGFHYHSWQLWENGGYCDLLGYMQSEKYFPEYNPFVFKQSFINSVIAKTPWYATQYPETILIHVRRGDYVGNQHYHQLPITYYIDALERFFPGWYDTKLLVIVSDDIPYCRVHFAGAKNIFFAEDFNETESMALASMCDNFILSNSSYSWWCAWLGEKKESKIVHPGHLFAGPSLKNDTKDFWPDRWTRHQKESYKIDLKDCTFTIPVYFDHKDRKQNLDLSVCMLQNSFDTSIIVGEQGSKMFGYMEEWTTYVKFEFKHFHRTRMLNEMAVMADTPYIANWDCDIVIAPMQVYLTVLALRKGADMVFPYDGRFARLPRMQWFRAIQRSLDIAEVKDTEPAGKRGRDVPENSVGGAVFFNKKSFIEGGMENENMISFGPEDCERNDRFTILAYRVERIGGCLYHIDHWIGPNSSKHNPFFKSNHLELDKIRSMSMDELKAYIKTWSWRPVKISSQEVMDVLQRHCNWAEGVTGLKYRIAVEDAKLVTSRNK